MNIDSFYNQCDRLSSLLYGVHVSENIDTYAFQTLNGNLGQLTTTQISQMKVYTIEFYHTDPNFRLIDYGSGNAEILGGLQWEWCYHQLAVLYDFNTIFTGSVTFNKFMCCMDNINPYDHEAFPTESEHYELVYRSKVDKYNFLNLKLR